MLHLAPTYPPLADDGPDLQEILEVCMLKIVLFHMSHIFMMSAKLRFQVY